MGGKTGPNPTDRGKRGVKRSLLTDGRGIPLAAVVDGANRNDHKLMRATVEAIAAKRPQPTRRRPQHLCLDKGYDYAEPRALAAAFGFTLHLRSRDKEAWAVALATPRRGGTAKPSQGATPVPRHDAGSSSAHIPGSTASVPS